MSFGDFQVLMMRFAILARSILRRPRIKGTQQIFRVNGLLFRLLFHLFRIFQLLFLTFFITHFLILGINHYLLHLEILIRHLIILMSQKRTGCVGKNVILSELRDQQTGLLSEFGCASFRLSGRGYACMTMQSTLIRNQINSQDLRRAFQMLKSNGQIKSNQNTISRYLAIQESSPIRSLGMSNLKLDKQLELTQYQIQNKKAILVGFFCLIRQKVKLQQKQSFNRLKINNQRIVYSRIEYNQNQKQTILKRYADLPRRKLKQAFMHFHFRLLGLYYLKEAANRLVLFTNINKTTAFYRMLSFHRKFQSTGYKQKPLLIAILSLINIFNKNISFAFTRLKIHSAVEIAIQQSRNQNESGSVIESVTETENIFQKCQKVERLFQIVHQIIYSLGAKTIVEKKQDIKISNAIIRIVANLRVNQNICFGLWRKHTISPNITVQTDRCSTFILNAEQKSRQQFQWQSKIKQDSFQKAEEEGDTWLQETRILEQKPDIQQQEILKNDQLYQY